MKQKLLFSFLFLSLLNKIFCQIPTGEVLWLKADESVIIDGNNKVSEWKDASLYANNLAQDDPTHQPKLIKNVFGKRSAIFFNGVNGKYFLSNQTSNLTSAGSARTVFIVGLLDSLAIANGGGDYPSAGGTMLTFRRSAPVFAIQTARITNSNAPNADYIYTAGLGTNSNAVAVNSNYYNNSKKCRFIDVFISSGAGTYLRAKQNDKALKVSQTNTIVSDYGATGFTLGDREDFSGQDWQGYIAEVIVYDRELSWLEIAKTEAYLSYKYHDCITNLNESPKLKTPITNNRNIIFYPDPVNNILTVDELPQIGKVYLSIVDLTGAIKANAELNNTSKYSWNISGIEKGNYILYIRYNGSVIVKKFIKQ
jgi:hypothetical protein